MVDLAQSREDACGLLDVSAGHLSHVLGGSRRVGLDLANRIKGVYAALGRVIPTEAWGENASPAEQLLIRETVEKIPRRQSAIGATSVAA